MGLWEFMDGWNITLEDILGFTGFTGHIYIITKLFLKEKIFSICLLFEKCIKNKVLKNTQIQNLRNMWTIENVFEAMTAMAAFLKAFQVFWQLL